MYTTNPQQSEFSRIVSKDHAKRLHDLLVEVQTSNKGQIIFGGPEQCDIEDKYIAPTLVRQPSMDTRLMTEEIFGPILPVVSFDTTEEAITMVNDDMSGTPLSMYVFTKSKKTCDTFVSKCPAGTMCRNDVLLQIAVRGLPFGGLGTRYVFLLM